MFCILLRVLSGSIGLGKRGLGFSGGINSFYVDGEINKYWALGKKWYAGISSVANIILPFKQPYINQIGSWDITIIMSGVWIIK